MTTGEKIRFYRELRNMTQPELAQLSGIPAGTIRKYEIDNRNPKLEQRKKIADALNISPNALETATFDTIGDVAPYLIELSKKTDIQFYGELDIDGNYCSDDIKISFSSTTLRKFLTEWANKQKIVDKLRADANNSPDEQVKAYALKRADEIEREMELRMVDSQILIKTEK